MQFGWAHQAVPFFGCGAPNRLSALMRPAYAGGSGEPGAKTTGGLPKASRCDKG
ncbi:hypothetical protein ALQ94_100823 [Pseudomonas amygdali pv. morsprunorum]|uniref:Uncharacterized protein n=1 Tax=Pseudomonas amygdali pv. morsprunorum TaxID=129138 RepID=A0A3M2WJY0_PSEA0|nr:hypothetical protein ALQ94_100823 [Pseudomonas amygdali pv. morsprunorum]